MDGVEVDCPLCGTPFFRDSPWKKICIKCYIKQKKTDGTHKEREHMPARPAYTQAPAIAPDMLRRLIQLCHPDKHANSEGANIATKFLLELRTKS